MFHVSLSAFQFLNEKLDSQMKADAKQGKKL